MSGNPSQSANVSRRVAASNQSMASNQRYWQQQLPGISPVFVRRPKAIVFDILGTASKSGFLERILFPYLRVNLEPYINTHWDKKDFGILFRRILDESVDSNRTNPICPIVLPQDSPNSGATLLNYIQYVNDNGLPSAPVTQLRFKVWFEGYQSSRLRTPIYTDVADRLRAWFAEGVKFHVFSNTWVEAQQALLKNTNHGDLTNLITGHYDNDFGLLTSSLSWRRLCNQIKLSPNDVLVLTKSAQEAHAAQEAGLRVVLVLTHRHNVRGISHDDRQRFPYVRTLNDLQWLETSMMPPVDGQDSRRIVTTPTMASTPPSAHSNAGSTSTSKRPYSATSSQQASGASQPGGSVQPSDQ